MFISVLSLFFGLVAADAGGHAWLFGYQSLSTTESGMFRWQLGEPSFLVDGSSDDRHESSSLTSLVSPQNPPPPFFLPTTMEISGVSLRQFTHQH